MKRCRFVTCTFFACVGLVTSAPPPESSIQWVEDVFRSKKLPYELHSWIKPSYLIGDFNGDGRPDVAVLIREQTSGKRGIAIVHGGTNEVFILGAGKEIGNAGDDFEWMDEWRLEKRQANQDALIVGKSESAGAVIYWDGKKYRWQLQGD